MRQKKASWKLSPANILCHKKIRWPIHRQRKLHTYWPSGHPCLTIEANRSRWAEHYEEALNHLASTQYLMLNDIAPSTISEPNILKDEPTLAEVKNSIRRLKNGKAPGAEDISTELLTCQYAARHHSKSLEVWSSTNRMERQHHCLSTKLKYFGMNTKVIIWLHCFRCPGKSFHMTCQLGYNHYLTKSVDHSNRGSPATDLHWTPFLPCTFYQKHTMPLNVAWSIDTPVPQARSTLTTISLENSTPPLQSDRDAFWPVLFCCAMNYHKVGHC